MTRVALLGFGTVGSAVARRLINAPFLATKRTALTHVFDRRPAQKRASFGAAAASIAFTDRIDDILRSDVDIVDGC